VFSRCSASAITRRTEASVATRASSTSPAPSSASPIMNPSAKPAAVRAGWPAGRTSRAQANSPTTKSSASPLVTRWVSSMRVAVVGARGTTAPLHSGQWLPQPAPEPEARTYAPHRITSRLKPRTSQAKRTNRSRTAAR